MLIHQTPFWGVKIRLSWARFLALMLLPAIFLVSQAGEEFSVTISNNVFKSRAAAMHAEIQGYKLADWFVCDSPEAIATANLDAIGKQLEQAGQQRMKWISKARFQYRSIANPRDDLDFRVYELPTLEAAAVAFDGEVSSYAGQPSPLKLDGAPDVRAIRLTQRNPQDCTQIYLYGTIVLVAITRHREINLAQGLMTLAAVSHQKRIAKHWP